MLTGLLFGFKCWLVMMTIRGIGFILTSMTDTSGR